MNSYQQMIDDITDLIIKEKTKFRNYILVGDNSSGKSEVLKKVLMKKKGTAIYFIDSVNRTFDASQVELEGKSYEFMNLYSDGVVEERLLPNNFNLQDTFKTLGTIEKLYSKYELKIQELCKLFMGIDIAIKREKIGAGLVDNKVIINGTEVVLSSGYQAVLRIFCEILYFCDILKTEKWDCGLVLIDELDEYLSPKYSSRIFNFLLHEFPDIRLLITSHSLDLVENAEEAELIIMQEAGYEIYNTEDLHSAVSVADIFTDIFFEDKKVNESGNDETDEILRNLLNLKISGGWNETAQNNLLTLKNKELLPHQRMIYKQIEEW